MPFAIKYGRRPIYIVSTAIVFAMSVWSSRMDTLWELYVTNLIMGLAGATNEALIASTIADLFFVHERATMNGLYMLAVLAGNFLSPMLAGVHATSSGWRWVYYTLSIFTGLIMLAFIFLYEETKYIPFHVGQPTSRVLDTQNDNDPHLEEKGSTVTTKASPRHEEPTATIRTDAPAETRKPEETTAISHTDTRGEINHSIPMLTWRQRLSWTRTTDDSLWELFVRPIQIMWRIPIATFAAFQYAVALCWLVNMIVVLNMVFPYEPYNFTPAQVGYMCVGPFLGFLFGTAYGGPLTDRAIIWYAKRNNGYYEPEMRLYLLHLPCLLVAGGLIMFGVTTAQVRLTSSLLTASKIRPGLTKSSGKALDTPHHWWVHLWLWRSCNR